MDRVFASKWFFYLIAGFAIGYLWVHFDRLSDMCMRLNIDWWR